MALALGLATAGPAAAECDFKKLGEVPIRLDLGGPIVDATINGQKVALLLSTGSRMSYLTRRAAERIGVKGNSDTGVRVFESGTGKEIRNRSAGGLELRFGAFRTPNADFFVVEDFLSSEIDGVLGRTILGQGDIEFDFANKMMRIFDPKGCDGLPLAYWSKTPSMADLDNPAFETFGALSSPVTINGRKLMAHYSTTGSTIIDQRAAHLAGVDPGQAGVLPLKPYVAEAAHPIDAWSGRFDFALGEESIKGARIRFASLGQNGPREASTGNRTASNLLEFPEMVLGQDFFMAHRVYFARSQRKIYFTYNGGRVFDPGQPIEAAK